MKITPGPEEARRTAETGEYRALPEPAGASPGTLARRKDAVPHTFPLAGTRPRCLTTTAETPEGEAVRRVQYPACGVQFHPGSILVPDGRTIPGNPIDLS